MCHDVSRCLYLRNQARADCKRFQIAGHTCSNEDLNDLLSSGLSGITQLSFGLVDQPVVVFVARYFKVGLCRRRVLMTLISRVSLSAKVGQHMMSASNRAF